MAYRVFVMYVVDNGVAGGVQPLSGGEEYPVLKAAVADSGKYPCLVLGWTMVDDVQTVIKDRRSIYNKFKNHNRYYKEYMEVFRYSEKHSSGLEIKIHELGRADKKEAMMDLLLEYVIKYKLFYGDRCNAREYILKIELLNMEVGFSKVVEVPKVLTSAEKRKISRKRYEESIREKLREKSKNYYAEHKEELAEKRRMKRQESKTLGNNPLLKKLDSIDE